MKVWELAPVLQKDSLAPVYLILGQEEYLAQRAYQMLMQTIPEEEQDLNIGQYDMEITPLSEAVNDAMSIPFFGERRLVFINRPYFLTGENKRVPFEQDIDSLVKYLQQPEETTTLVIMAPYGKLDERKKVTKVLKKQAVLIDVNPLQENEVRSYLNNELMQAGYQMQPGALQSLLERTEAKLSLIMAELPKLFLLAQDDKLITQAQVERMVSRSLEQNVFGLVEFVLQKRLQDALTLYHDLLLQKEEPLKINAILLGQFRLLLQTAVLKQSNYDQGSIASSLKVHPYRVSLALKKLRYFRVRDLKRAYLGLVGIEEQLKSTNQDPELLFQLFLLKYTNQKQSA